MNPNPLVSICCITYNHEKYIEKTIQGFLIQKTKFPIEIIIHDDNSQDNSVQIIKKYQNIYPNIIRTILQKENQYSKGKKILLSCVLPHTKGEYIALCEGDDYWTDPYKLQKQLQEMKKNPKCNFSFHPSFLKNKDSKKLNIIGKYHTKNKIFYTSDAILGGGGFCPTASIMFKKQILKKMPIFFLEPPIGDYPLQIFFSLYGGLLYIPQCMSVYRSGHINSWTQKQQNYEKYVNTILGINNFLDKLNKYTKYKYQKEIKAQITFNTYNIWKRFKKNKKIKPKFKYILKYFYIKARHKIKTNTILHKKYQRKT